MKENQFLGILLLIKQSRANAIRAVNSELINLYWNIGSYISKKIADSSWGNKTVDELADYIRKNNPDLKGFERRSLYRMKQFYETYASASFVIPEVKLIGNVGSAEIVSAARTPIRARKNYVSAALITDSRYIEIYQGASRRHIGRKETPRKFEPHRGGISGC